MCHQKSSGFSIVVLSFLLAVAGILIMLLIPNDTDKQSANIRFTNNKIKQINTALSVYYETNSLPPCPAKVSLTPGTTGFGVANCTCGSGIICPSTSGMGNLLLGSVPVKTLGLTDDYSFDEWGHRFTYAMDSSSPPQVLKVKDLYGTLDVNSKGNQPIAFFFSHGPNGRGAYLRSGTLDSAAPCTGAAAGEDAVISDLENCDATNAATADRVFVSSLWNYTTNNKYDDLTGKLYKKSWVGFKDDGAQWLLFQMDKSGVVSSLASAVAGGGNNLWTALFGTTITMGPVSCNLADNGKTICVTVGNKYVNSSLGCNALAGGCGTYWAFTARPETGFVNNANAGSFNAEGVFNNFNNTLFGSKPNVKCWKVASTRFLCMAVSDHFYKVFSMDTETGLKDISAVSPTYNGAFSGKNFWGSLLTLDTAGFDCAPSGNAAGDFICMAAGQGGSFLSFKLNEATGITNKTGMGCYGGYGFLGALALTNSSLACGDANLGGQARDVSCNMLKGSTTQAACVAVYNKTYNVLVAGSAGRAVREFIATTSTTAPGTSYCPATPTGTTSTCLIQPAASGGDNLKAMDGIVQFSSANLGDVFNLNCNGKSCFIGGTGSGSTASGYIGLYNYTNTGFSTTAVQSLQPAGGVFMPSCSAFDENRYYCLYSGTGSGAGCAQGSNSCSYSVWSNYKTKLNSGTYTAWPVDTSWSYFSIAK